MTFVRGIFFFALLCSQGFVFANEPLPINQDGVTNSTLNASSQFLESVLQSRDPFKAPDLSSDSGRGATEPLERYSLDTLRLIGILTGPDHYRALIAAPDGKTFTIGQGTKVGQSGGVVQGIGEDRIVVTETVTDLAGKMEVVRSEMMLEAEGGKKTVGQVESGLGGK